jgi:hypothetical protein
MKTGVVLSDEGEEEGKGGEEEVKRGGEERR